MAAEPLHWTSGWNWQEPGPAAGPGNGRLVEIEYWRLPVRATSSSSPLRTLDVRRHPGWDGWHLTHAGDD